VIKKAATVRQQVVDVRLKTSKQLFEKEYPAKEDQKQIRKMASGGKLTPLADFGHLVGDVTVPEQCPACRSRFSTPPRRSAVAFAR
jgi:hypothetical protein